MIASLPMYDWPEVRAANDRLWAAIRDGLQSDGVAAPDGLTRSGDLWADWQSPDLLLSQTCGYPYRTGLHDKVTLVGTPDYGLPGAPAGHYYSVLVARRDGSGDWATYLDKRLAINGFDSQSGWAAPQNHAASIGRRFENPVVSGAHAQSVQMVADGKADIAAVDAVTWRLVVAFRPETAAKVKVVARTDPTPGLPIITAKGRDPKPLARAFAAAVTASQMHDRADGLRGFVEIPTTAYLGVPTPATLAGTE